MASDFIYFTLVWDRRVGGHGGGGVGGWITTTLNAYSLTLLCKFWDRGLEIILELFGEKRNIVE